MTSCHYVSCHDVITIPLVEVNQAIIILVVKTKIKVGAMSNGAGGLNQKILPVIKRSGKILQNIVRCCRIV